MSIEKAFELASQLLALGEMAGASSMIIAVAMPDGGAYMLHGHKGQATAQLDYLAEKVENAREGGWPCTPCGAKQ